MYFRAFWSPASRDPSPAIFQLLFSALMESPHFPPFFWGGFPLLFSLVVTRFAGPLFFFFLLFFPPRKFGHRLVFSGALTGKSNVPEHWRPGAVFPGPRLLFTLPNYRNEPFWTAVPAFAPDSTVPPPQSVLSFFRPCALGVLLLLPPSPDGSQNRSLQFFPFSL